MFRDCPLVRLLTCKLSTSNLEHNPHRHYVSMCVVITNFNQASSSTALCFSKSKNSDNLHMHIIEIISVSNHIHNQYFKGYIEPLSAINGFYAMCILLKSYSKIRFCLTRWKTVSIAISAARNVHIFMVCAVMSEPLLPVAQQ